MSPEPQSWSSLAVLTRRDKSINLPSQILFFKLLGIWAPKRIMTTWLLVRVWCKIQLTAVTTGRIWCQEWYRGTYRFGLYYWRCISYCWLCSLFRWGWGHLTLAGVHVWRLAPAWWNGGALVAPLPTAFACGRLTHTLASSPRSPGIVPGPKRWQFCWVKWVMVIDGYTI